jgi:hypothetical protein
MNSQCQPPHDAHSSPAISRPEGQPPIQPFPVRQPLAPRTKVVFGTVVLGMVLGLCLLTTATVQGQILQPVPGGYISHPIGGWDWSPWGWGHPLNWNYQGPVGVTPAESYARGMAELVRARSEAAEREARAMVDYEAARSEYLKNQEVWQKQAIERQREYDRRREERLAADRASRERRQMSQPATRSTPELSRSEYDPASGRIVWPKVLQNMTSGDATTARKRIAELAQVQATAGRSDALAQEVSVLLRQLQAELRAEIRNVPASDYIASRKFLEGLQRALLRPTS